MMDYVIDQLLWYGQLVCEAGTGIFIDPVYIRANRSQKYWIFRGWLQHRLAESFG